MSFTAGPAAKAASTWHLDLIAGLSIAGLLIPEAVAYAGIAHLPPQAGVIALLVGLATYGLLGRSRFAVVSATSSSAAVLAAGTLALSSDSVSRVAVAGTLVLLAGGCFLVAGVARLGGLSHLIARPVLRGYTFGLACVIAIKQLPHLLGVGDVHGDFLPALLAQLARVLPQVNPAALGAGLIALALLFACERFRRLPGSLVAIACGVVASGWLAAHGVALVGAIELSVPLGWPAWPDRGQWLPSIELAAALLLILYAESYSAIRGFALKHGDTTQPNRDLLVLGVANVISGALHGMPVGAGYSGTSANEAAGAQSRWAGVIAAVCVLLLVLLALRWIERIPQPVLAAIVIHAVSKSLRVSVFAPYLRWHRDRLVLAAAIVAVLSLGILNGLLCAIAFSVVMLLRQLATPRLSVLGRLASGHDFVDMRQHPEAVPVPGMLVVRPEEPLFFANAEAMLAQARHRVDAQADLQRVVLSLEESPDLDGTSLESIGDFATWLAARGIELRVARLKDDARDALSRLALPQLPPQALEDWSVEDAVLASTSSARGNPQ